MSIWSHLMLTTIIFGPQPAALLSNFAVDSFDYANWVNNLSRKKVSLRLLKSDPHKFDELNDAGFFWSVHHLMNYSVWFLLIFSLLAYYSFTRKWDAVFYFSASWVFHMLIDFVSHKRFFPLFPIKSYQLRLGIFDYHHKNLKATAMVDVILFIFFIVSLIFRGSFS